MGKNGHWRGRLPGRADGYPSGPPTDPYGRHARIRVLRQSGGCPAAVPWRSVVRVGALAGSPLCPGQRMLCPTAPSLPWVPWALVPPLHRDAAPLRLPSVPLGGFACRSPSRYLACFHGSWCPMRARDLVEAPSPRQGLWSPGPPLRVCGQGDRWLSHVPEFPL